MTLPPGLYLFGATATADRLSTTELRETLRRLMERLDTQVPRSVIS